MTTTPNEIFEYIKDKKCPMCKGYLSEGNDIRTIEFDDHWLTHIDCGLCLDYLLTLEYKDPKKLYIASEKLWLWLHRDGTLDLNEDTDYANELHIELCYSIEALDEPKYVKEPSTNIDYCRAYDDEDADIYDVCDEETLTIEGILFDPHKLTKKEMLKKIETYLFFR